MKLIASAITTMTRPGNVTSHHFSKPSPWPSSISVPSDGFGGWIPKPRKDSAASIRIAAAMISVVLTMIGPSAFGSM